MARFKYTNNRLQAYITQLPGKADRAVDQAARKAADEARQRAPVDTGELRGSITVRKAGTADRVVEVGAEHGIYQEFGTYKMAAQPFLLPAMRAVEGDFATLTRDALQP